MRYPLFSLLATFAILIAAVSPLSAQERITASQLRSRGVEASSLQPIAFSHDSRTIACFDRAPFEEKKQGTFFRLWFFRVQPDGRLGDVRSVDLPLKNFQQGEFTPADDRFVVLGNRGTTFLSVRLNNLSVEELLVPEWGEPGFRGDPPVLWAEAGKLFALGHFYDKERFVEPTTIAVVNPQAAPSKRFERGPNIAALEKGLERLWVTNYLTDSAAFFAQKLPHATVLSFWDGEKVREFDRGAKFSGFWAKSGRLIYSRKSSGLADNELVLYDSANGNLKVLDKSQHDFRYLFLSRDGKTLLVSHLVPKQDRVTVLYAREEDGWTLKSVAQDRNQRPVTLATGWMRLSSDGKWLCYVGSDGLSLYSLK